MGENSGQEPSSHPPLDKGQTPTEPPSYTPPDSLPPYGPPEAAQAQPPQAGQQPPQAGQQPPVYGQQPYPQPPQAGQQPPVYGQPPYPQPPVYGQPPYPQPPVYGQPPYPQPPVYGQPPYPQPPYGQPYLPPYGQPPRTNTLAVVSLVSSFFVNLVAIITGHMALNQIKRTGESGRGLAIAGLVIGYTSVAFVAVLVVNFFSTLLVAGLWSTSSAGESVAQESYGDYSTVVPSNSNSYGGITFTAQGEVVPPDYTAALDASEFDPYYDSDTGELALEAIGIAAADHGEPVQLVVYLDFLCPHCASFNADHAAFLQEAADGGLATVEYRPIAYLDDSSQGSYYSSRAAGAAACVADARPQGYVPFLAALFTAQPAMDSSGLDNEILIQLAQESAGVDIADCLSQEEFDFYVLDATDLAVSYEVPGTPAVYVNGVLWESGTLQESLQAALLGSADPAPVDPEAIPAFLAR